MKVKIIKLIEKIRLYISELFDKIYWYLDGLNYPPQKEQPKEDYPTKEQIVEYLKRLREDREHHLYRINEDWAERVSQGREDYELRKKMSAEWYCEQLEKTRIKAVRLGYISEEESLQGLLENKS